MASDYYYPLCPKEIGANPLETYFSNFRVETVFAYKDDLPKLIIVKFVKIKNNPSILVMCEREGRMCERDGFKPWSIYEITFENDSFSHSRVGSYFEKDDANEVFYIKQGLKWAGDNIFDGFC